MRESGPIDTATEANVVEAPDPTPFAFDTPDAHAGVLLCHGFTGSPASLRPWGQYLHQHGFTAHCPLLPGHGTHWRDMNKTTWRDWYATVENAMQHLHEQLAGRPLFVMGLSMGGTLATRLVQEHHNKFAGLVLVNPSYMTLRRTAFLAPVLSRFIPSVAGIGSDIKDVEAQDTSEGGYDRTPLRAFASLRQLWRITRADLASVRLPVLVFHSVVDNVVEPANTQLLLRSISSTDVTAVPLHDSYHVATLDTDAPRIFAGSVEFAHRVMAAKNSEVNP